MQDGGIQAQVGKGGCRVLGSYLVSLQHLHGYQTPFFSTNLFEHLPWSPVQADSFSTKASWTAIEMNYTRGMCAACTTYAFKATVYQRRLSKHRYRGSWVPCWAVFHKQDSKNSVFGKLLCGGVLGIAAIVLDQETPGEHVPTQAC